MRTILSFIIILILGTIAQIFLPWWTIAIICFLVGLAFCDNGWGAFFGGLLAVFCMWGFYAFGISVSNDFILAGRMSELFGLPSGALLYPITALVGGLLGGLSALSGYFLQTFNQQTKKRNKYA
ncbi:MAG: hypothetical protein ACPG4Z_05905 [Chitinophagales bacterium]